MNIQKQLEQMLSKALRSLAAARRNLEAGDYDFASSSILCSLLRN